MMLGLALLMWGMSWGWRRATGQRVGWGGRIVMGLSATAYIFFS